jgi:hypothetical protein
MPNTQLKELNFSILQNLKDDQPCISLTPLLIEKKEVEALELGDIIYFDEVEFIVRDSNRKFATLILAKRESKEGFLIVESYSQEIDKLDSDDGAEELDIRVATISSSKILVDSWISFNWSIRDNLTIFSQNRALALGKLVRLERGFGVLIKEIL